MVGLWGMSEELGPVSYGVGERSRSWVASLRRPQFAEATAARIDAAVEELLEQARMTARSILSAHRPLLDAIANELITTETVSGARLAELAGAEATGGSGPTMPVAAATAVARVLGRARRT